MPVFQHLQQIAPILGIQLHQAPVIQEQDIHLGELGQQLGITAIALPLCQNTCRVFDFRVNQEGVLRNDRWQGIQKSESRRCSRR